jgi:succinate dehydrogenase/fumarate reductase flavoprotein subunit
MKSKKTSRDAGQELPVFECDVVVAGGGISGMCAAVEAARTGARVIVLEKDRDIGGNAKWAGAFDLQAPTYERMRAENPDGDPDLQRILVDRFLSDIAWLKDLGVELRDDHIGKGEMRFPYFPHQGEGGIRTFKTLRARLEEANGTILLETGLMRLLTGDVGNIIGVLASGPQGPVKLFSRAVVLATGSFTRNNDLKLRYFGPNGDRTSYYGSDRHDGDGIIAALEVGAALSTGVSIGQGTCVFPPPYQPPAGLYRYAGTGTSKWDRDTYDFVEKLNGRWTDWRVTSEPVPAGVQRYSLRPPCFGDLPVILVNIDGKRYVDESWAYTTIGWKTTQQTLGTGFCIFDQSVYEGESSILEQAIEWGAVVYKAQSLSDLVQQLRNWRNTPSYRDGVNGNNLIDTVQEFNKAVEEGRCHDLEPPREGNQAKVERPPFYAVPVVQGVVDSVGGVKIDGEARGLDRGGNHIPGLFAAGADAGRAYTVEHGGLSFGLIFGRVAGAGAARL